MKLIVPDAFIDFAEHTFQAKTPVVRTQGWDDDPGVRLGQHNLTETVGTLMLWQYLVGQGVHASHFLTGNGGDETDLRVYCTTSKKAVNPLDINVKTSLWQPAYNDDPCSRSHIAVKQVEFAKALSDLFIQVFVHIDPPKGAPHVHLGRWILSSAEAFKTQPLTVIPKSQNTKGFWIGPAFTRPIEELVPYLQSLQASTRLAAAA